MKFECFCGQSLEVNDDAIGQSFRCPSCGNDLVVPGVKKQAPVSFPPSPKTYTEAEVISLLQKAQSITSASPTTFPNRPITIERTSKKYKGMQLVAALLMIVGVVGCMAGSTGTGILFIIGIVVWIVASIGSWWDNG